LLRIAPAMTLALACALPAGADTSSGSALLPIDKAALQQVVESMTHDLLVPGAVVILDTPKGEFRTTVGTTTFLGSVPVGFDQHVRVGSNTKTWTATVILQQVQEGLLRLDDKVSRFRSDVPNGNDITIEQLLTMRSGLANYSETLELNRKLDAEPHKVWTPDELLALAFRHPPDFPPGTGYHYSNTNYVLLGLIAEKLDHGKPLAQIFRDRLFAPLGLEHTLLPGDASNAMPNPYAHGYMYGDNVSTMGSPPALPPDMQAAAHAGTLKPADYTEASPSWTWAAGGGISTANDLVTWVDALVSGKLLGRDMQRKRLASIRPVNPDDANAAQYGWGIAKMGPLYGHTGELPGYNSFMGRDPVNAVTLVVWTNLAPAVDGRDPATSIARAVAGKIYVPGALRGRPPPIR
jgi:CubicO group peptidase (beta-lactamase class C family)